VLNGVRAAHLHTAVTGRSQFAAAARPTPAAQRLAADRLDDWGQHCPHRSETWDSRQRLLRALRRWRETLEKAQVGRRNCALLTITKTYHGIRQITLNEVKLVVQGFALVANMATEKDGAQMQ